ncbi:MAG: class I SAM-dependent methyltransferase [Janthinobacterium lividum]
MDAKPHASLPVPDAHALARSTTLVARIAAEIAAAGGWLPFSRYMEMALYTPGLGYYSGANRKFGRSAADGSDFITAPHISPFFARALARPVADALALAEADEVLEFGAGTGLLAAQLLNALADDGHGATTASRPAIRLRRYTIVELSGELRERQRETLAQRAPAWLDRVRWLDALPERFHGVVIGNEVLDAMPVQLHPHVGGAWFERGVALDGTRLVWRDRPAAPPPDIPATVRAAIDATAVDYLIESHAAARAFIATVCAMLTRGAAIFIDYGFPAHEYYHPQRAAGTLMCHYRHQAHDDPLLYPGLQDITAHVEFSGLTQAALDAGADVLGYMSQARFLINAGIAEDLGRTVDPADPARYLPAANGVQKLLSESEMGELFKVIGFSRGLDDVPRAFDAGDRSWTLLDEDEDEDPSDDAGCGENAGGLPT